MATTVMDDKIKPTVKSYRPRSIKRNRRTKAQIEALGDKIVEVLKADHPMTCRHLFYRLVSSGDIPKDEKAYKQIVLRLLTRMRRGGRVPFAWITDSTRWVRGPVTHRGIHSAVSRTAEAYRRAMWDDQDVYVEVWCEKDAVAGTLRDVTYPFDVPLMVTRGFSSITFTYSAAEKIEAAGKPAYIYIFSDHDPSGTDLARKIGRDLKEFAPKAEIHVERVAVTPEQIERFNLPTRPTKKSDTRSKRFKGESVELDAMSAEMLREVATTCITRHIEWLRWNRMQKIEDAEREVLRGLLGQIGGAGK